MSTITISIDGTIVPGEFRVFPAPQELDSITVEGTAASPIPRIQAFERRLARGVGHFVTQKDIEEIHPFTVSGLLRRIPGIRITDSLGVPVAMSARGDKIVNGRIIAPCVLRLVIDGTLQPWGTS